jgi:hypothetical protein
VALAGGVAGDRLHLVGGIPPWREPITLTFAAW